MIRTAAIYREVYRLELENKELRAKLLPNYAPTRLDLLQKIFDEFQSAAQNNYLPTDLRSGILNAPGNHFHRAEVLIELLESADCGSWGGYDLETLHEGVAPGTLSIYERFEAVLCKYNQEHELKCEFGWSAHSLGCYWKKIGQMCANTRK